MTNQTIHINKGKSIVIAVSIESSWLGIPFLVNYLKISFLRSILIKLSSRKLIKPWELLLVDPRLSILS